MDTAVFVGIDVSKAPLDVAQRPEGPGLSVPNTETGITTLVAHVRTVQPVLIVVEATGGWELPLVRALVEGQLPVVVVNPRQVRDFAKATGQLAKTDALDAHVLARFAEAVQPALRPVPDVQTQALAALVARRRQLTEMLTAEKNRPPRRCARASNVTLPGSNASSGSSTGTWIRRSERARSGESTQRCLRAFPASARW